MNHIERNFFEDRYEITAQVEKIHDGFRLDQFVQLIFTSFSREFIKKKIQKKEVIILKRPGLAKPSTKLHFQEKVFMLCRRDSIEDEYWNHQKIPLQENLEVLLHEPQFCVINKPPFMCAHPTGRHVFYCATVYASRLLNQDFSSVHRLDRETSGVLLLASNPEKGKELAQLFEYHKIQKYYFLIAHKKKSVSFPFTAHERIGERVDGPHTRLFMYCFPVHSSQGKSAITEFHLLAENDHYYCVLAKPKTGRQHQIRTHAAYHGFPLVGDKIYNDDPDVFYRFKDQIATSLDYQNMQLPRHALHALAIEWTSSPSAPHSPAKKYFIQAPLPSDLITFLREQNLPTQFNFFS